MATNKQTAVVTGAAGVARRFVEGGHRVVIGDADVDGLETLSTDLNRGGQTAWKKGGRPEIQSLLRRVDRLFDCCD